MTARPQRMELADYVRELTQPHTHSEHYTIRHHGTWYGRNHTVQAPPLIDQLARSDTQSAAAEDGPRSGYSSRPVARLDALAALAHIDLQAARWITDLGEQPRSLHTTDLVLQLHGLSASADLPARKAITASVRSWWITARIVTGWDDPAWRPNATCPQCGMRGTLSVRFADKIGRCSHDACEAVWDEATIGLLADHIRSETQAQVRAEGPGPCWCAWPAPSVPDLSFLCTRCSSARCRHAVVRMTLAIADVLVGTSSADLAKRHKVSRQTALRLIRRVKYDQVSA